MLALGEVKGRFASHHYRAHKKKQKTDTTKTTSQKSRVKNHYYCRSMTMVDQTTLHQGYAGTKRPGSEVLHSEDEEHIVQTTKSKGIVNVQLFIRSKSKEVCFFFFFLSSDS